MPRLGGTIDDHCSRCKRTTDRSIMALVGDDPAKVICRTCNTEHKYRGNKSKKTEFTAAEAWQKLVASATAQLDSVEEKKPNKKR